MPSPFFKHIKNDVLLMVQSIARGHVTTYASMGAHIDVVPRHIAYILSQLSLEEQVQYPWWRVVGAQGALGQAKWGSDNI